MCLFSSSCRILNGVQIAKAREKVLRNYLEAINPRPSLAVILVGHNAASEVYVCNKQKACSRVGINFQLVRMTESIQQNELVNEIHRLNEVISL